MSKIVFHKVSWKNFLSTGNNPTTISLDDHSTTLIMGENGAGKSTLLDAIIFGLYGKPYRKINKPQLPNSINKKKCLVELEFTAKGTSYRVLRGLKPDVFEIYKIERTVDRETYQPGSNEELLNQDASSKDYQNVLEQQILGGLDHKAFLQTAVLGSANYTPFLELPKADRSGIVEDILDIKIFSVMNTLLKEQIADSKAKEVSIEADLERLKIEFSGKQELITKMESMGSDNTKVFEEAITTAEGEISRLLQSIATQEAGIPSIETRLASKQGEIAPKEAEYTSKQGEITSMEQTLAEKQATHQGSKKAELQEHNNKLSSEISVLNSDKARHEQSLKFYGDNDNCPTCTQPIQPDFKTSKVAQATADIAEIDKKVAEASAVIETNNEAIKAIDAVDAEINEYKQQVDTAKGGLSVYSNAVSAIQSEITEIERELETAKNAKKSVEEQVVIHQNTIAKNKQSIENAKTANTSDLEAEKAKLEELREKGKSKADEKEAILNLRGLEDKAKGMLSDKGIKTSIIHEYLPVLNTRINHYLVKFDSYISFNIDETFNEVVKSRHRDNFSYANFSEGEKLRIDLSLLLAFRDLAQMKNSTSTNLLLMDEVFDASLDSQGADFLMEIIRTMDNSNIVVISHRADQLLDKFSRVIPFKKQGDYSVIGDVV